MEKIPCQAITKTDIFEVMLPPQPNMRAIFDQIMFYPARAPACSILPAGLGGNGEFEEIIQNEVSLGGSPTINGVLVL